jgi:hypothetical protein
MSLLQLKVNELKRLLLELEVNGTECLVALVVCSASTPPPPERMSEDQKQERTLTERRIKQLTDNSNSVSSTHES